MTKTGVIVRAATESDYPAIAALLDRIFTPRPYEQRLKLWRWRYDANPAKTDTLPPFLVGEQGGTIVGVHGLVPLRVKVMDRILVASCGCDLVVDPRARSVGMKIKLKAMSRAFSPLYISTSANEPANKITLALGGKEVGVGRCKLIKPLKASGILRRIFGKNHLAFARAATTFASVAVGKPLDWALAVGRAIRSYPAVSGAAIEEIRQFDQRFDRFWETISREANIMHVRDAAYLNWRFARYPFAGIESFALVRENEILGLAVIHKSTDSDGLPFVAILELLVPRGENMVFDLLLREIVNRSAKAGTHAITARASTARWEGRYTHSGFRLRRSPFSGVTYKNNSEMSDDLFAIDSNWYVSLGDGDDCYYFD